MAYLICKHIRRTVLQTELEFTIFIFAMDRNLDMDRHIRAGRRGGGCGSHGWRWHGEAAV